MRFKQIDIDTKIFALIMDTGDEIGDVLRQFASTQKLGGSSLASEGQVLLWPHETNASENSP
jgi:hypothetical protein